MKLPAEEGIGPCTLNIGVIEGGRAPNVVPDKARAQLLYRLVGSSEQLKREIVAAVGNVARVEFVLEIPFVRLRTLDGLPTMVAAFTTDIPALGNWGQPLLVGPGSIHVAHTDGEYVEKKQLHEARGFVRLDCTATLDMKLESSARHLAGCPEGVSPSARRAGCPPGDDDAA